MEDAVDLLILGSGSTAFAAALTAQELKKTALMREERPVGGTCGQPRVSALQEPHRRGEARIRRAASSIRRPDAMHGGLHFAALIAAVMIPRPRQSARPRVPRASRATSRALDLRKDALAKRFAAQIAREQRLRRNAGGIG